MPAALWLRYAAIVFLGVIAHLFVLQAGFYLDDDMHIVGNPVVESGAWLEKTWRWIPYFVWSHVYSWFGTAAPAYHALTFATHLVIACLIYPVGQQLLTAARVMPEEMDRDLAPWIAALIFVCHPITTEPVHYARCLMIDLVALFTLLTVWRALVFSQEPGLKNAAWLALAMILGVSSKQPGIGHVTISAAITIAAFGNWRQWRSQLRLDSWRHRAIIGGAALAAVAVAIPWISRGAKALSQPGLFDHALTQSRIFWEYVQRIILPTNLSVDHYITWTTTWRDPGAIVSVLALAAVVGLAIWLFQSRRWKLAGVLCCLALAQVLIRFGYVVGELMVEYRVYPAMPWIALGVGCGLVVLMRRQQIAGIVATALILVSFTGLTMKRSHLWTDIGSLATDAAEQYPLNLRAWGSMQFAAALNDDPQRVLDIKKEADVAFNGTLTYNREHTIRGYEISRLHLWYATFLQHCSFAKTKLEGLDSGALYSQQLLDDMIERYPDWYLIDRTERANPLVQANEMLGTALCERAAAAQEWEEGQGELKAVSGEL